MFITLYIGNHTRTSTFKRLQRLTKILVAGPIVTSPGSGIEMCNLTRPQITNVVFLIIC